MVARRVRIINFRVTTELTNFSIESGCRKESGVHPIHTHQLEAVVLVGPADHRHRHNLTRVDASHKHRNFLKCCCIGAGWHTLQKREICVVCRLVDIPFRKFGLYFKI